MSNLKSLIEQRAALDAQIKSARQAERADAIAKIRTLMEEYDLSPEDLVFGRAGKAAGGARMPSAAVAPKYRDGNGNTWSGRGLQPKWLKAAIKGGATQDSFKIPTAS